MAPGLRYGFDDKAKECSAEVRNWSTTGSLALEAIGIWAWICTSRIAMLWHVS